MASLDRSPTYTRLLAKSTRWQKPPRAGWFSSTRSSAGVEWPARSAFCAPKSCLTEPVIALMPKSAFWCAKRFPRLGRQFRSTARGYGLGLSRRARPVEARLNDSRRLTSSLAEQARGSDHRRSRRALFPVGRGRRRVASRRERSGRRGTAGTWSARPAMLATATVGCRCDRIGAGRGSALPPPTCAERRGRRSRCRRSRAGRAVLRSTECWSSTLRRVRLAAAPCPRRRPAGRRANGR